MPRLIINAEPGLAPSLPHYRALQSMAMSGSGAFNAAGLAQMVQHVPHGFSVTLVDLRAESHGFVDGLPVSWWAANNWANRGLGLGAIEEDETRRLEALRRRQGEPVAAYRVHKHGHSEPSLTDIALPPVRVVQNESTLAASLGINYLRLPMLDHTSHPDDSAVNALVSLATRRDNSTWLHFHCQKGKGRTTLFMTMIDILSNCQHETLEYIVARQFAAGGVNLMAHDDGGPKQAKYAGRRAFLAEFYAYCRSRDVAAVGPWKPFVGSFRQGLEHELENGQGPN